MTIDEWTSLDEDVPGELVSGELIEEEMPDFVHELVVIWLSMMLWPWVTARGGVIGGSDAKYIVARDRGRKADLSVFFSGRLPPRRGSIRVPPDLFVEVVTATPRDERRDRVEKLDEYEKFGVQHYWIVDPELRILDAYTLRRGRYSRALSTNARIRRLPGFPGLEIDLRKLWAQIDRLPDVPTPPASRPRRAKRRR